MYDPVALATVASPLLAALALGGTWWSWRSRELRRDEVLAWGTEAITAMQTLVLICQDDEQATSSHNPRLAEVRFATSILVERGRLFFRNVPHRHGANKEPAYRGIRPLVLDHLVVAHQIATAWPDASSIDRAKMRLIAEGCLKKFVSLVQKEVGRARTASTDTSKPGDGSQLQHLMNSN